MRCDATATATITVKVTRRDQNTDVWDATLMITGCGSRGCAMYRVLCSVYSVYKYIRNIVCDESTVHTCLNIFILTIDGDAECAILQNIPWPTALIHVLTENVMHAANVFSLSNQEDRDWDHPLPSSSSATRTRKKASRVLDQEKNINRGQAEEGKGKRRIHSLLISSAIIRSAYSTRIINRSEGSTQGQKVNFQDVASS